MIFNRQLSIQRLATAALFCVVNFVGTADPGTEDGWQTLFNGKDFEGWVQRGKGDEQPTFKVTDGMIVGSSLVPRNSTGYLATTKQYANFELTLDVMIDDDFNSGIQVRSMPKGAMRGPQVEISSVHGKSGFIYGQGMAMWFSENIPEGKEVFQEGKWYSFRILVKSKTIKTWINGEPMEDLTHDKVPKKGVIALQVHSHPRGKRREKGASKIHSVTWKNIMIRELD